jgi:hypothetical protein
VILALLLAAVCHAAKTANLPEIIDPSSIHIFKDRLYIHDRTSIHIYSINDYKHIKKFGRKGEGPGEFGNQFDLSVSEDGLFVSTEAKAIFFNHNGELIREFKTPHGLLGLLPVGKNFIASAGVIEKGNSQPLQSINLYNEKMTVIKILYKGSLGQISYYESGVSKKQDINMIPDNVGHYVYKDRIYLSDTTKGFFFQVFNPDGKKINDAAVEYKKIKVANAFKKEKMKYYTESPRWEWFKESFNFIFPGYYPAYSDLLFDAGKIYFLTYKSIDKIDEVVVTDLSGKYSGKTYIPSPTYNGILSFTIFAGKFYYLLENEKTETWELHIENLKNIN